MLSNVSLSVDPEYWAVQVHSVDHPDYGVLQLRPWRIVLADTPAMNRVWPGALRHPRSLAVERLRYREWLDHDHIQSGQLQIADRARRLNGSASYRVATNFTAGAGLALSESGADFEVPHIGSII